MNNKIKILSFITLSIMGLTACGSDSDNDQFQSRTTGDTLILTSNGKITSIDRDRPTHLVSERTIQGLLAGDELVGIDYRPKNGLLYGVGKLGHIYTLDPVSGNATFVVKLTADPNDNDGNPAFTQILGDADLITVNFNPAVDRLRVMTNQGQNLRINVDTGATITDTNLTLSGSANVQVVAAAYTNAFSGTASTKLFSIDQSTDRIYLQNANAGTLGASAALGTGIDTQGGGGFDIDPINNNGFAALKVAGKYELYAMNLASVGTTSDVVVEAKSISDFYNANGIRALALKHQNNTPHAVGLTANNQLVRFETSQPNSVSTQAITGLLVDEKIVGIDFRLRTTTDQAGRLYGLSNQGNLYTIDAETGASRLITALKAAANDDNPFTTLMGEHFAVDFNPVPDRLRVINDLGQNLRINVDTGDTITDGNLNGVDGAKVTAAAYTNSFSNMIAPTATTLFNLDQGNAALLRQAPPNDGKLNLIAPLGISLGLNNGFDIAGGDNGLALATASSSATGPSILYRIDINPEVNSVPRARFAVSQDGSPNMAASTIGSSNTPAIIDLALTFK